jgi:ABC-type Fe3+-hydroxamate transport system substrate-binding protein
MRKHRRFLALFFGLCLLLSACRSSPVLMQEVHVQEAEDQTQDQELSPEDQGQEDERFQNEEREDLDTQRDTENNEGIAGDISEADQAVDVDQGNTNLESHDTPNQASGGTGTTAAPSPTATAQASKTPAASQQTQQSQTPTVSQEPDTDTASKGGDQAPAEPSQEPEVSYRQIVDATGDYVDIPENLRSCTAVGVAAQLALMLGGSDALLGADENVLYSGIAGQLGVSAQVWWSGSGTSGISDDCFSALLAAKPDACFVISGQNTFSEAQTQQLKDAGIAVVTLYALSSVDSLSYNAQIMGEAFQNEDLANDYVSWVNDLLAQVSSATSGTDSGTSSLYLCGWDTSASYEALGQGGSGAAYAYAYRSSKSQLMSAMMEQAGVVNTSTDASSAGQNKKGNEYIYVMPQASWISGAYGDQTMGGVLQAKYDQVVTRALGERRIQLGEPLYKWIIVDSQNTKDQLEASVFWQYYESDGLVYINGQQTYKSIVGDYEIYVAPQGQFGCDLAEASVETPIEAWWVAAKLLGTYSLGEVQEKTRAFYQEFYGITLSDDVLYTMFGE